MPFTKLGLADQLVQGILATGYTAPTTIQSRAIPSAVAGRDIIGCAQTGTGKTAAFVLPMLNHFIKHSAHPKGHHTRGLVLTPTRELAQQVEEFVTGYGRFANFQSLAIYGGVSMENQIKRLRRGVDIVVATPGRLLDHIDRRTVDLSHVEILVIDEADRMFDMGFINDVRKIISRVPSKRQTLLFSATMSSQVKSLVASVQINPELIEIGEQRKPVETVKQYFYSAPQELKMDLLLHILSTQELDSVLIFSRTKHGADKISHRLERSGIKAVAIHSNRTQAQRQRALAGFKQGQYKVMVATDIAARGIDVEGISHVVNYDTPTFAEDYIHRVGRTGRAFATGDAITFVSNMEQKYVKSIERFIGRHFELKRYPDFDYSKRVPAQEKKSESGMHQEHDANRNAKRDRYKGQRHKEHSGRQHNEYRNAGSSDKRHDEKKHTGSAGKHYSESRHKNAFRKPYRGNNNSESPQRSNNAFNKPDHKDKRQREGSNDNTRSFKKPEAEKPVNPALETDWKSLVSSMEDGRGGLRKKIKKLFIREKV